MNFDVVIVDEASQATEPATWCALFRCSKFVLFGDTNQLAPLVKHPKATKFGLGQSLMERLALSQPSSVAELNVQYRMNEQVQVLPNELIYNGKLICGNATVHNRLLTYEKKQFDVNSPDFVQHPWLKPILNPAQAVIFLNTEDQILEEPNGQENRGEAELCKKIADQYVNMGINPKDIGILSPYRRQLAVVKEAYEGVRYDQRPEILTVDEAQGKDKKCIIVTLVRSNTARKTGQLLKEWRRMNVLLTRAQSKLVLVGGIPTLRTEDLVRRVIEQCHVRGWIAEYKP